MRASRRCPRGVSCECYTLGVRPTGKCFAFVFCCGATIAPLGDHFHVARGVTEYLTDFGPLWIGNSPLWFVLLVATFMATLAVAQGGLRPRADEGAREAPERVSDRRIFLSPLMILGLYLATSFYPWRDGGTLEVLITAAAALLYVGVDRTRTGLLIGAVVAIGATATEWTLVELGVFRYLPGSDELFGVAPWLLPLYFAASVAVGAVGQRMLGRKPILRSEHDVAA